MSIQDIATMTISASGYDGTLPEDVVIQADTGMIDLSISKMSYINQSRSLLLNPQKN